MTRREALLALLFAFLLIVAGLTWLLGPWGLLICGILLAGAVVLGFDQVPEGGSGDEALADPLPEPHRRRRPVQPVRH